MRLKNIARHFIALLSTFVLSIIASLIIWTAIFSISMQGTTAVIMSGSMEPGVSPGDVVISQEMSKQDLANKIKPGHVLVFQDPSNQEQLITHRVNEKVVDETGALSHFITKGDANRTADSTPVEPDKVAGVARILIPVIGLPIQGIKMGNFIPAIGFFVIVSLAFMTTREELARIRSAKPNKGASGHERKGKHVKIPTPGKTRKYAANAVTLFAIIAIVTSSSIVMSSSQAAFAASTVNAGCTFTSAPSFGTTEPSDYVEGDADSATYCWSGSDMPSAKNFKIPFKTPGTNTVIGEASLIVTYDADKFGFDWKLTLPPSHPIQEGATIRIIFSDVYNQVVTTSEWLDSRSFTGHAGIYVGSNLTVGIDILDIDGNYTHDGYLLIKHCVPHPINSLGASPFQFCSVNPLVNQEFVTNLTDASGAGRAPIQVQVAIRYTNPSTIAYTLYFPNGTTTTTGMTMTATNAAGTSASSTIAFVSPKSSGTINLDNTGSNVSFRIDTTAGRKATPDWRGSFTVNICSPTTWG